MRLRPPLAWTVALVALVGFALRIGVAVRTLDVVDRMFVPDDTYYTLSIARSLARGLGPTVDGVHLTNGFQPLLAFAMVPVYLAVHDADVPLRVAWFFLSACDVANAVALGCLVRRAARRHGDVAGLTATTAWALSPLALSYALGGLETSLALLCATLLALQWARARESLTTRAAVLAGVVAGCALLARIDLVFLVMALAGWELVCGSRALVARASAAAGVVVAPWWMYELLRFRTVVPQSGQAVRAQAAVHQALWLTRQRQLAWAVGTVLEAPIGRLRDMRLLFTERFVGENTALLASAAIVLAVGLVAIFLVRRGPACAPLRIVIGFGVVVWFFYALYVPAVWFFPRYLAPMHVTLTLVLALVVGALWGRRIVPRGLSALGFTAVALVPAIVTLRYTWLIPDGGSLDAALHGAKGYRSPAREILAQLPDGAVLGALQTGALGYYGLTDHRAVVNLDGVVDEEAAEAFRAHRLGELSRERGITYFADWVFNTDAFLDHCDDAARPSLIPVGAADPQGTDRFTLFRLAPPTPPTGSSPR